MSLHFLSHAWEVQDVEDGTRVKVTPEDFAAAELSAVVDELFELAQESGRPVLYLDFVAIRFLPGLAVDKLRLLDQRLKACGSRLVLNNASGLVDPSSELSHA